MNRTNFIHVLATAMALATGGLAFGRSIMPDPNLVFVQVGKTIEVGGHLTPGSYPLPVPVIPPAHGSAAILSGLDRRLMEIQPNDALRRIERLVLLDGGLGVDLAQLAQVIPATAKVRVTGKFGRFFPATPPVQPMMMPRRPFMTSDSLAVTKLSIDGQDIWAAPANQVTRLAKLAERRAHAWIREQNPHMADGPEAVTDSVSVISHDLVVVNVHFVSGWTHQPIEGMTAKLLVSIRADSVRLVTGRLP